jgi:hypothetical protein
VLVLFLTLPTLNTRKNNAVNTRIKQPHRHVWNNKKSKKIVIV